MQGRTIAEAVQYANQELPMGDPDHVGETFAEQFRVIGDGTVRIR
jgi:hypothetical protein